MAQLQQIEADIAALPGADLRSFRAWFDDFDATGSATTRFLFPSNNWRMPISSC